MVNGRLENAELPVDTKHPLILPGKHLLTRLVVLHEHAQAGHAGPSYTLMKTRQMFWIIHGILNIKRILTECSVCARRNETSIRQLVADLPSWRIAAVNKPFKICGIEYCGPFTVSIVTIVVTARLGVFFSPASSTQYIHVEV